jgi:hypothetical protein
MAKELKKVEEPKVDGKVEKLKIKKRTYSNDNSNNAPTKLDLSKPQFENKEVEEKPVEDEVIVVNPEPKPEEVVAEEKVDIVKDNSNENKTEEDLPVLEEVTQEEIAEAEEKIQESIAEAKETGKPLPEKVEKLVKFMEETGGDLNDYVNLNKDISKMNDSEILDEYYKKTKSHLTHEERDFMLDENFGYDEEEDDPKVIQRKKIALKEQVAEAKAYLDGQKSKYYEEIKAGSRLTPEAKKAMDFFNRYNKETEKQNKIAQNNKKVFETKTNSVFNKDFKGFDYQVGDKRYRFNVKDTDQVKTTQSDINNFVNKFVDKETKQINDAVGYHKSLFTAMNADAVAKHFYEQGRADAIKGQVAKDKNIDMNPRKTHGEVNVGGVKYRVLGDSADGLKVKIKRKKQ